MSMKNIKIHYDPFLSSYDPYGEDASEKGVCGIPLSEFGNVTNTKSEVTCKKCIKKFSQADTEMYMAINHQLIDMQGFVDFHSKHSTT